MEMLRRGSSGDAVEALQKKLLAKGVNPGSADGIFGPKTEDAVRRFQEREGLQVDGIVGPKTFGALGMLEEEADDAGTETHGNTSGGGTGPISV